MHEIVKIKERGISPKEITISKKEKKEFSSWFKFQLDSSNGVGCSDSAYIHTQIHSDSIKTEGTFILLQYVHMCFFQK